MNQREIVINQLEEFGYIGRNWALKHYISRLGAIIYNLKDYYDLAGKYKNGDYIYILIP